MPQTLDEDMANTINAEDRAYTEWEHEQKNRILRMPDEKRKQVEWNKIFIKNKPTAIPY